MFSEDTMERFFQISFLMMTTSSLLSSSRLTLYNFSTNTGSTILFLVDTSISLKSRAPIFFLFESSQSSHCSIKNLPQELLFLLSREVAARTFFPSEKQASGRKCDLTFQNVGRQTLIRMSDKDNWTSHSVRVRNYSRILDQRSTRMNAVLLERNYLSWSEKSEMESWVFVIQPWENYSLFKFYYFGNLFFPSQKSPVFKELTRCHTIC